MPSACCKVKPCWATISSARTTFIISSAAIAVCVSSAVLDILGGDFVYVNLTVLDGISDARLAELQVHFANGRDNDWMNTPDVTSRL